MNTRFENHPLHAGEGVSIFIGPGILKTPTQAEAFFAIEDPSAAPLLYFGAYTLSTWPGLAAQTGLNDFYYDFHRRAAGNARYFPNGGIEALRSLKTPIRQLSEIGIKTVIQVTSLAHEDPKEVIPRLVEEAALQNPTAIEIDLSCQNSPEGANLSEDPKTCGEIMYSARREVGDDICLGLKDAPHVNSPDHEVLVEPIFNLLSSTWDYIDFVCGINTIGGQEFPEITCTGGKGGMSGPIVAPVARQHLQIWQKYAPDLAYLSIGGVDSNNADVEIPWRLEHGAMRVGGAQEFYRAKDPLQVAARWAIAAI